jgi:hypothetical protein
MFDDGILFDGVYYPGRNDIFDAPSSGKRPKNRRDAEGVVIDAEPIRP